jgi:hypothetical protein
LKNTLGVYDIGPWSNLNLDPVSTFMDFYTVIASNPPNLTYSVTYGYEPSPVAAICRYGERETYFSN